MKCGNCKGRGWVLREPLTIDDVDYPAVELACFQCNGTGELCDVCGESLDVCECNDDD